jgi:tetratricopeptide (TPR) repeat protein
MKPFTTLIVYLLLATPALANDSLVSAFKAVDERDYERAIETLTKLSESQQNRDVLFHLARALYQSGDFDGASDILKDFHQRYPDDSEAYYLEGLVYVGLFREVNMFKKIGMINKARASWEASVAADPRNIDARYGIFFYYTKVPGGLNTAREMMIEINQLDEAYGALAQGELSHKEKDKAGAETAFQEAAILMNRAGPYFSLAQFYMQTEQYEKAISSVQQFRAREKRWWDPDVTVTYLVIARANAELGNIEVARKEAELGLSMNPSKQTKKLLNKILESL